jgi:hypothetical protein
VSKKKQCGVKTLLQPATENRKGKQRTKDQETKDKIKHESRINNSASLTLVQGLSTEACMMVSSFITSFLLTSS